MRSRFEKTASRLGLVSTRSNASLYDAHLRLTTVGQKDGFDIGYYWVRGHVEMRGKVKIRAAFLLLVDRRTKSLWFIMR